MNGNVWNQIEYDILKWKIGGKFNSGSIGNYYSKYQGLLNTSPAHPKPPTLLYDQVCLINMDKFLSIRKHWFVCVFCCCGWWVGVYFAFTRWYLLLYITFHSFISLKKKHSAKKLGDQKKRWGNFEVDILAFAVAPHFQWIREAVILGGFY